MKIIIPNADSLSISISHAREGTDASAIADAVASQLGRILAALPAAGRISGTYGRRSLSLKAKASVVFKAPAESAPETKVAVIAATLWGSLAFAPISSLIVELSESLSSELERKFRFRSDQPAQPAQPVAA